ncbi:hypothetical protein GCM10027598_30980 [Amycolatopsis oliviviridis]|uniref:Uncharacterized protein n=1 Tax=Amycolatopsis oliviviridis TaxID=1471590 RepID=A0ABQ3M1N6_9PSEU|nr:hypothetical protein [Amycolatopsis oliviviridis]GHH24612.1 hypothetical protein GCM10017790_49180 [Amycolatopsis oliviviridis]
MEALRNQGLTALRLILAFTLLSTTLHYAHNVIRAADYPQIEGIPVGVAATLVAIVYFVLTAIGLLGYRDYLRGRYWRALGFLMVFSLSGLASLGHFLVGVPQVPAFWFATIFTDGASALMLWGFVIWASAKLNRVPTPAYTP